MEDYLQSKSKFQLQTLFKIGSKVNITHGYGVKRLTITSFHQFGVLLNFGHILIWSDYVWFSISTY
jgi:hypothetical protein